MPEPLMRNPYAASKRWSDVQNTEWPATTFASAPEIDRWETLPEEEVNQHILTLLRARKNIYDAMVTCRRAAERWQGKRQDVFERLSSIATALKVEHSRFPLSFLGNPLTIGKPSKVPETLVAAHDSREASGIRPAE